MGIWDCNLKDFSFLGNFTDLEILYMGGTEEFNDLSFLSKLKYLRKLAIIKGKISDFPQYLTNHKKLKDLYIYSTKTSDIRFLEDFTELEVLNISDNDIKDIEVLRELTKLTDLYCHKNQITNLEPVTLLKKLKQLCVLSNQIAEIDCLAALTSLEELNISDNNINNVAVIENFVNLRIFSAYKNKISNLESIHFLKNLKELDVSSNQITDISPINGLTRLETLDLSSNKIESIKSLQNLVNLRKLGVGSNQITDIQSLEALTELEKLRLSSNKIENINPLKNLQNLNYLNLGINQVSDISAISELSNLNELKVYSNNITDISYIFNLTNLRILDFDSNQISDINSIKNLNLLEEVYFTENQLNDISALKKLTIIKKLFLNKNQITDIDSLKELVTLERLELENNLISNVNALKDLKKLEYIKISNNKITEIPAWLVEFPQLYHLEIMNNPIQNVPIEIYNKDSYGVVRLIRDHLISVKNKEEVFPLYEAKLIIVGKGEVGKSELVEAITLNNYEFIIGRKSTEGIRIKTWEPLCKNEIGEEIKFKVHLWDFGGQDIYWGIHQYFLTKNSVYLLVWDARKEEVSQTFGFWLQAISLFSEQSPTLVVQNKADERTKNINQEDLTKNFPFIKGFYRTSCKEKDKYDLMRVKEDLLTQLKNLPHIGEKWNIFRIKVRNILEKDEREYISQDEYFEICKFNGLDESSAKSLSERLHILGVILHFQDDLTLQNIVILKPEWATSAFYKIRDDKIIKDEKHGNFDEHDLERVWNDPHYNGKFDVLLRLMIRFEICFQFQDSDRYIVPEMCLPQVIGIPDFSDKSPTIHFDYNYIQFLPNSIISKFICRNHKFIYKELFWQFGVVLKMDNTIAIIKSTELEKRIIITVQGDEAKEVLYHIRQEFKVIHENSRNPQVEELVPCSCIECKKSGLPSYFKYEILQRRNRKGMQYIICEKSDINVSIAELTEGIIENLKMNKKNQARLEELISRVDYAEFFKLIQEIEHDADVFASLRKEFTSGSYKLDANYPDRLKVALSKLDTQNKSFFANAK